ncbi:MAG: mechanosensitive ion channel family protein [Elainella sp. C42_A2020_010]|nr:mechanosensitive ion channel family protein [Elainella sp. C42_A2020_010]
MPTLIAVWSHSMHRRLRIWLILSMVLVLLTIVAPPIHAQENNLIGDPGSPAENPAGNPVDGYPVVLDGQTLFRVKQDIPGIASAQERAAIINSRLTRFASDTSIAPETIRVEEQNGLSVVLAGDTILLTVADGDREGNQSRQELAEKTVQIIQSTVTQYRQARSAEKIIRGIIWSVLSTVALIGLLLLLQRWISRLLIRIRAARQADALDFRIQGMQLLGSDATSYLLSGLVKALRLALILGSLYLYIPFVLSQFPSTRAIGNSIFSDIAARLELLIAGLAGYLPNLAIITIIGVVTYYLIQFAKLIIIELGRDNAYPWFYPEWVQPTNRLAAMLLIAMACVVAAPYLPGFGSPGFQGISLFLGALLTLGSSSAIANVIAGVILIYTRAFRSGDVIRIGDIIGEVTEKTLFVTRILTPRKEVITIPNSAVLSSNVVNFHAGAREFKQYLLLHTTVTLGYDLPWRKVHDVLIQAALSTSNIVPEPGPFVLQTALNDFNVSYELNAYTNHPEIMPRIYSELHQNIQDYCNQAGIEILSPTYSSLRDGNHSTLPGDYLPDDYSPPSFQIQSKNGQ